MKRTNGKRLLSALLTLTMLFALAGCGSSKPKTAEEYVNAINTALTATPCTQMDLDMSLKINVSGGDVGTMALGMDMNTSTTVSSEPVGAYALSKVILDLEGEPVETEAESYTVVEDDAVVVYNYAGGVWTRTVTGQSADTLIYTTSAVRMDTANLSLDETVTEWNGTPAACLVTSLSGSDLQDLLSTMIAQLGSAENGIDLSALTCDGRIYVSSETYLPIAEELTISGMGEVIGSVMGLDGVETEVPTCTITVNYKSYEAQNAVTLPENAKEQAAAWEHLLAGDPANGDGTYTIREGMALVDVVVPEGFEVTDTDYDHVTMVQEDNCRQITYTMFTMELGYPQSDYDNYFYGEHNSAISRRQPAGVGLEREKMVLSADMDFSCDFLSTTWENGRTDAELRGWCYVTEDDSYCYYLLVEVADGHINGSTKVKDADITPEEFISYLNAASISSLSK